MMKPLRLAVLSLCLSPLVSLAAPTEGADPQERTEKHTRMLRVLELADELGLNESQALKMADVMRQFDDRRQPLIVQVHEAAQVLRRAARGDASMQAQVDAAVQRAFDARAQIASLDHELYQALAKELPPQQRAQLAIFLAHRKAEYVVRKFERAEEQDEQRQQRRQQRQQLRDEARP